MLTLLLTAIVFYLTRQIIRADELPTQTATPDCADDADLEDLTDGFFSEVATLINSQDGFADLGPDEDLITINETPCLDPAMVMAIDLSLLLP